MTLRKNFHWLIYLLFVLACARQTSPTGGPKDTIPPVLTSSNPVNGQILFKGKTIELTFSELITLAAPKEQLIITPTIGKDYEISARNDKVILQYERDLQDSTTYTFNFRDAVQDITEKNPARNLKLAFSTGHYIDSLSIQGTVTTLLDQKPVANATFAIEPYSDTFNILKHPATYFTKTEKDGSYKLENLKPGKYLAYAISDQNKNLLADTRTEAYGFRAEPIKLDSNITNLNISLVRLDTRPLKLTSARPYNTYFNIRASKNLKTATVTAADSIDLYYSYGADKANIQLYNSFADLDSLQIHVSLFDSIQNRFDTTLYAKFSRQQVTPEPFTYKVLSSSAHLTNGILKSEIQFSKPLDEINFDSLSFQIDSLNTLRFVPDNLDYDELEKILTITAPFDKKLYELPTDPEADAEASIKGPPPSTRKKFLNKLALGKGAFISIEQDSSTAATQKVTPQRFEDMGIIHAQAILKDEHYIIQLLDSKRKVIASTRNEHQVSFEDLLPNDYYLRIIIDKNNNGVWDPGNYLSLEEPEDIIYYKNEKGVQEIKLKANFEIGPLLITY